MKRQLSCLRFDNRAQRFHFIRQISDGLFHAQI